MEEDERAVGKAPGISEQGREGQAEMSQDCSDGRSSTLRGALLDTQSPQGDCGMSDESVLPPAIFFVLGATSQKCRVNHNEAAG